MSGAGEGLGHPRMMGVFMEEVTLDVAHGEQVQGGAASFRQATRLGASWETVGTLLLDCQLGRVSWDLRGLK